jgi:hypothetical protein
LGAVLTSFGIIGCSRQPPHDTKAVPAAVDLDNLQDIPYVGETEVDDDAEAGVVIRSPKMQPGYTLLVVHRACRAELIDEAGNVQRTWSDPGADQWSNAELLPNGDLITTGSDLSNATGIEDESRYAMRLAFDGTVIWKRYLPAHHDITLSPRDELVALAFKRRRVDAYPGVDLRDDCIMRLSHAGEVLESVCIYDSVRARDDLYPLRKKRANNRTGTPLVDLFHLNSVEWMHQEHLYARHPLYGPTCVIVCSRHQNRVAVFEMRTGDLVWAWGADELDGPHDASVLEDGHILVFDNGLARGWSRVVELDPLTDEIVWSFSYAEDRQPGSRNDKRFYSGSKGSAQRLANGNTLICSADRGEIFEVTRDGEVVWRYFGTDLAKKEEGGFRRASLSRAYRLDKDWIDGLLGRRGGS